MRLGAHSVNKNAAKVFLTLPFAPLKESANMQVLADFCYCAAKNKFA